MSLRCVSVESVRSGKPDDLPMLRGVDLMGAYAARSHLRSGPTDTADRPSSNTIYAGVRDTRRSGHGRPERNAQRQGLLRESYRGHADRGRDSASRRAPGSTSSAGSTRPSGTSGRGGLHGRRLHPGVRDDGAPAPQLASAVVHFPRGASLRSSFLTKRFFCDAATLQRDPNPESVREAARFASRSVLLDAQRGDRRPDSSGYRSVSREGRRERCGGHRGRPGQVEPAVARLPLRRARGVPASKESSAARRYGYRLDLPTLLRPLLPYVTLSLAEMKLKITVLTLERRKRPRKLFWLKTPDCPRGHKVTFGADYAFEGAQPISRRRSVSCARFLDLPSAHRKGQSGRPGCRG